MMNGSIKVILEHLDMKSILKNLLTNRVAILCVFDIAIIIWIAWFDSCIQYEPLLDNSLNIDGPTLPLIEQIYNTMIVAIVVNIIVIVIESRKVQKRKIVRYNLTIAFIYLFLVMFCILWGYCYLSGKIQIGVIGEDNLLFRFPIWVFGKELLTNIVTVTRLYLFLCVIHMCIYSFYVHLCLCEYKKNKANSEGTHPIDHRNRPQFLQQLINSIKSFF